MYNLKRFKLSAIFTIRKTTSILTYNLLNKYMSHNLIKYIDVITIKTEYNVNVYYTPKLNYTLNFCSRDGIQDLRYHYFNYDSDDKSLSIDSEISYGKIIFESITGCEIDITVDADHIKLLVLNLLKSIKKGFSFEKSKRKMLALLT